LRGDRNVRPPHYCEPQSDRQADQDADERQRYRHHRTLKDGSDIATAHDVGSSADGGVRILVRTSQGDPGMPRQTIFLKFGKSAACLFLGDEFVQECQQLRIALGNGPRREGFPETAWPTSNHGGFSATSALRLMIVLTTKSVRREPDPDTLPDRTYYSTIFPSLRLPSPALS